MVLAFCAVTTALLEPVGLLNCTMSVAARSPTSFIPSVIETRGGDHSPAKGTLFTSQASPLQCHNDLETMCGGPPIFVLANVLPNRLFRNRLSSLPSKSARSLLGGIE